MRDNATYLREMATTPHCRDRGHCCLLVQVIENQSLTVCDSKEVTSEKTSEREWRQMVMVGEINGEIQFTESTGFRKIRGYTKPCTGRAPKLTKKPRSGNADVN